MKITITISGQEVESINADKYKHLEQSSVVAYLKNKYVDRILSEPWEIAITVMSKMHRVEVSDFKVKKGIERVEMKIDRTGFDNYSNTDYLKKYA